MTKMNEAVLFGFLERIAKALETLASDVSPPALQGLDVSPVASPGQVPVWMPPAAQTVSMQTQDTKKDVPGASVAGPGVLPTLAETATPATTPIAAASALVVASAIAAEAMDLSVDFSAEAQDMQDDLVRHEKAKTVLGARLHDLVWATSDDGLLDPKTAIELRRVAVLRLGGVKAFEVVRDRIGVKPGALPDGKQARRLALDFLTLDPREESPQANGGKDVWS
jgi:hypothetical protein